MRNRIWTDRILEALPETALFQGIQAEHLPPLLQWLQARQPWIEEGQYLWEAGQPQQGLCLLLEGRIRLLEPPLPESLLFESGDVPQGAQREPPALLGLGTALQPEALWPCCAQAETKVAALFLRTDRLQRLVGIREPELAATLQRFLFRLLQLQERKLGEQSVRLRCLSHKSMRGKLADFLLYEAQRCSSRSFRMPATQEALAYQLQVSRPSMIRVLQAMQEEGLLRMQGKNFELLDWSGLQRAANERGRSSPASGSKV